MDAKTLATGLCHYDRIIAGKLQTLLFRELDVTESPFAELSYAALGALDLEALSIGADNPASRLGTLERIRELAAALNAETERR